MVEESGYVIAVEKNHIWVSVERRAACESCSVKKGCGSAVLSKVVGKKIATIKVKNLLHVKVGNQVRIGISDQAMIAGSAFIYLLPLLLMFLAAIIVNLLLSQELYTIIAALAGLIAGFTLIKLILQCQYMQQAFQAQLIAIENSHVVHFSTKLLS